MAQNAKVMADAFSETKLMMRPVMTGDNSFELKSVPLMTEFILVNTAGG